MLRIARSRSLVARRPVGQRLGVRRREGVSRDQSEIRIAVSEWRCTYLGPVMNSCRSSTHVLALRSTMTLQSRIRAFSTAEKKKRRSDSPSHKSLQKQARRESVLARKPLVRYHTRYGYLINHDNVMVSLLCPSSRPQCDGVTPPVRLTHYDLSFLSAKAFGPRRNAHTGFKHGASGTALPRGCEAGAGHLQGPAVAGSRDASVCTFVGSARLFRARKQKGLPEAVMRLKSSDEQR
nr:hypothetical protein CFP56_00382 [Quercus suber]